MFAAGEPVTFIEAGAVDDPYSGEPTKSDWDNPTTVLEQPAAVEPIGSTEPLQDGRQSVIVGYRLYFDSEVTVDPAWRAVVRGDTCEVQGKPALWRSPFASWTAGTVVQVGLTRG